MYFDLSIFNNLDFLTVGIAITLVAILSVIIFVNDRASATSRAFVLFACSAILWSIFNFLNYQVSSALLALWFMRLVMFFAVWYSFSLFHLFFVFPNKTVVYPLAYKYLLLPLVTITSIVALTPILFPRISEFKQAGQVAHMVVGPGIILFSCTVVSLVVSGILLLFQKYKRAQISEKKQLRLILIGVALTFCLHLLFNFLLPAFFDNPRFIPFGALFIFPFAVLTFYALLRHNLLNIKVVTTEVVTMLLTIITLSQIVLSQNIYDFVARVIIFILLLIFSIFLIQSVQREVEEREQLSIATQSLEQANVRLQELDKQKTDFLSIAAHQLRTPLSIINGYTELITDGAYGKVGKGVKEILGNIDESNGHLIKLVDEFLDITRIEQGRTKYDFVASDVRDIVDSAVKELIPRAEGKGLKLEWKRPAVLPKALVDSEKIRHVVFNFIDNAIKYSVEGKIHVTVDRSDGGVAVRVIDQGFGFGPADQANFFQKFYRGDNVKGTNVNGTGLGLYVCRKFIEAHGGRVWATSPGLHQGSEFGFWVPLKNTPLPA